MKGVSLHLRPTSRYLVKKISQIKKYRQTEKGRKVLYRESKREQLVTFARVLSSGKTEFARRFMDSSPTRNSWILFCRSEIYGLVPGLYLSIHIYLRIYMHTYIHVSMYTRKGGRVLNIKVPSHKFRWRLGVSSTPRDLSIRWIFKRPCRNLVEPESTSKKEILSRKKLDDHDIHVHEHLEE